jgi:hypothetical protein
MIIWKINLIKYKKYIKIYFLKKTTFTKPQIQLYLDINQVQFNLLLQFQNPLLPLPAPQRTVLSFSFNSLRKHSNKNGQETKAHFQTPTTILF